MTKPKPSDIPQAIRDRAAAQMQDTLYDDMYRRLIDAYGRKPRIRSAKLIGWIGFCVSIIWSIWRGLTRTDWEIYLYAASDGFATYVCALALSLLFESFNPSDKEPLMIRTGLEALIHRKPTPLRLNTLKTIATAGAAAGQTRTIFTIFFLGLAVSLLGKDLFGYVITPIQNLMSGFLALAFWVAMSAIVGILVEVQKASTDTDMLKAIAYYEEYLAEEALNPAPALIQPIVASTPAPAAKPMPIPPTAKPTAAKPMSPEQKPQPKQTPQGQSRRTKKKR